MVSKRQKFLALIIGSLGLITILGVLINRRGLRTEADISKSRVGRIVLVGNVKRKDGNALYGWVQLRTGIDVENIKITRINDDGSFSLTNLDPNKTYFVKVIGYSGILWCNKDHFESGQFRIEGNRRSVEFSNLEACGNVSGWLGPDKDDTPPTIKFDRVIELGANYEISFTVEDPKWGNSLGQVLVFHRSSGGPWQLSSITQQETTRFIARIPKSDNIEYFIQAAGAGGVLFSQYPELGIDNPARITSTSPPPISPCFIPEPLKVALVACYSADEGSGAVLQDLSGKGNDGTLNGARWDANGCKVKGCMTFTTNDSVTIADNPTLNPDSITVAAWVRPDAQTNQKFLSKLDGAGKLGYALSGSYCCLSFFGGSSSSAYQPNQWVHLAGTAQQGSQAFYINGQLTTSGPFAAGLTKVAGDLKIGGFPGAIDEVLIFNRVLTAEEISQIYKQY